MRIVIIGLGYVGKAIASHWRAAGHIVTATTRSAAKAEELRKYADRIVVLENEPFSHVLKGQEAALLCVAPDSHSNYEATYLHTARSLLAEKDKTLCQIIYTSSTSVYGDHVGATVDELTTPKPDNENTKILLEAENALSMAASQHLNVCIFRLGEIIGPGRQIADRLRRMNGTPLPGDGQGATNLSPLADIIHGLDFALQKKLNGLFNLCNDLHIPRKELYDTICRQEGIPPVLWEPSRKSLHAGNKIVSNHKLKALGFAFNNDPHRRIDGSGKETCFK